MGLKETLQSAAKTAANAFGNIVETVTYRKGTGVTYAPAVSGTPTETFTTIADIDALWANINTRRIDGRNVLTRDRIVVVFAKDLGATIPAENGEVLRTVGDLFSYTGAGTTDNFSFEADPYNTIRGPSLGNIAVRQIVHIGQAAVTANNGVATITGKNNNLIVVDKALAVEASSTAVIQNVEIWRVIGVSADPAGATYTLHVRQ